MTEQTRSFKETYVVTGEINWAVVQKPDADGTYRVEITVTPESRALATKLGLTIYTSKDGTREFLKFKRPAISKAGETVKPPKVLNTMLEPVTELIGNGSYGSVEFFPFDWTDKKTKRSGTSAYLVALQIKKLIPYTPTKKYGKFEMEGEAASETNKFSTGE